MTSSEIILVRDSFRRIVPISDLAAALFYARLFEVDPSLRSLFHGELTDQGRKFMHMLGNAVASLEAFENILPAIRELGGRHQHYGVQEHHYASVGVALLWTLEKGLGPDFTAEMRDAWSSAYSLLANTMIDGARETCAA